MRHALLLTLALALTPAVASAQPTNSAGVPPSLTTQQRTQLEQLHAQMRQNRVQLRARILAGLTSAQRNAVANIVGQLALAPDPNRRAAAQAVDNVLTASEKQSVLALALSEKAGTKSLREQQKAIFESSLNADRKARKAQHEAQRQAFRQSHPRASHSQDAGAIVLHTLACEGNGGSHHHHRMM